VSPRLTLARARAKIAMAVDEQLSRINERIKMSTTFSRRPLTALAIAGTVTLALAACNPGAPAGADVPSDFSGEQVRIIVPAGAGGSMDSMARQLQPFLADALGATVVVENMASGGAIIGTQYVLDNGGDCLTVLATNTPHLNMSYIVNDVQFDLADFAPVAGVTVEPGAIRVRNDAPWQTLEELVEDALERPGEITFSVSDLASSNAIGLIQIEEATGADFKIVGYDGGGPARTALLSGEVAATHAGVFNTLSIAADTRVLAVHEDANLWREQTGGAPTVSEALGEELPAQSSHPSVVASAECADTHSERYDLLVKAFADSIASKEYLATLTQLGEDGRADYLSPEKLAELLQRAEDEIRVLLEEDPNIFTGE